MELLLFECALCALEGSRLLLQVRASVFPHWLIGEPRACCSHGAFTARSWRSTRARQLRLTYLDKKWMPCETSSSPECDVCRRRGCFPAHSSGISDPKARRWIGAAHLFWRHYHGKHDPKRFVLISWPKTDRSPSWKRLRIVVCGEKWALYAISSTRYRRRLKNWDRETRWSMNWSWSWTRKTNSSRSFRMS